MLEKSRQEGTQFAKDVYSGIGDFVFNDVPGAIEWATQDAEVKGLNEAMKNVQSWWQDVNPRSEIPAENITRDLSSVILPSIYAPSAAVGAVGKATQAFNIGRRTRILGSAAASIGIDTTIAGISGTSARDQNLSRTLNDSFGWNIPWATRDDDSPDVMRKKNMIDNLPFAFLGDAVGAYFSLNKAQKIVPFDEVAEAALKDPVLADIDVQFADLTAQFDEDMKMVGKVRTESGGLVNRDSNIKKVLAESKDLDKPEFAPLREKLVAEAGDNELARLQLEEKYFKSAEDLRARRAARVVEMEDPVVDAVEGNRRAVDAARTDEGLRRLAGDPEGVRGPDPYINQMTDMETPTPSKTADPLGAKVDYARMADEVGTVDGQARSVATDYWQKQYLSITDATERSRYLS